ncbi:cupin domain-containing protein [Olivibacter sp. XZL3]|uniref:cupin domain-containing protein n=1 Tax=Olivibacter sp. XZL3 TaxID=1735116 RepID=UPI0010648B0F|nr:cupin domain-containing protein [Olivibacter sp. XZL3]
MFNFESEAVWKEVGEGVSRKMLSYNEEMMVVRVRFKAGAVGEVHQHLHTQITCVVSGKFEFSIGDEKRVIASGDTCLMPSNVLHGCVCLEEGELLDVFTPARQDFL